ncbi:MAG: flagellar hook-associated protein FlgL [Rhodocyclales bacterium]|nr:flagellar hook-associated protein FlgL [Rhodocyclales bacterium]
MRIATSQIFDRNIAALQNNQAQLAQTQAQVASGKKMLKPSDDPVRAARSLELQQSQSVNQQFLANIGYAKDQLALTDTRLSTMTDTLQYMRQQFIKAGNGGLSAQDKAAIASDLRSQLDNLVALANSKDGQGEYLFSGYKNDTAPIAFGDHDGNSITPEIYYYQGDAGTRQMQVGPERRMDVSVPGSASGGGGLFEADQSTYVPAVPPTDPTDPTTGTPAQYPPAEFFNRLKMAIDAIDPATATAVTLPAGYTDPTSYGLDTVDAFMERIAQYQSKVGSQRAELDSLDFAGQAIGEQYAAARSRIEDLDYNEALSRLAQQQLVLQAAQMSFARVANLSLFQYL